MSYSIWDDIQTPYEQLPTELRERILNHVEEGNTKRDLAIMLVDRMDGGELQQIEADIKAQEEEENP